METGNVYDRGFNEDVSLPTPDRCPECDGALRTNDDETICSVCGLVVATDDLDRGPEWRSFDEHGNGSNPSRVRAPITEGRHDRGLTTEIGRGIDGNGNAHSGRKRRQLGRLSREQHRGKFSSKRERNLAHGCSEIARMVGALGLGQSVREEASQLFRQAQDADLLQGRSIETIAAGCLYAACRCRGLGRTLGEVSNVAFVDRDKVKLGYSALDEELGIPAVVRRPTQFLPTLQEECSLPIPVVDRAHDLVELAVDANLTSGRKAAGVAAACAYLAAQEHGYTISQQELAEAVDTTPVTLRSRYEELQAVRTTRD